VNIVPTCKLSKNALTDFFVKHWGSPQMVISSGIFICDELDGFAVVDTNHNIIGLLTYLLEVEECEIISLDSLIENKGIGSTLLQEVEYLAKLNCCKQVKVITTNDNLHALGFYQKRGYQLKSLYVKAVDNARKIKPEIPLIAENGIQIRDEILLVKKI
jgi:GNAT superfamily N-acetyltransferase